MHQDHNQTWHEPQIFGVSSSLFFVLKIKKKKKKVQENDEIITL